MKKDSRGFFLAETIVVISLVTIVIAFMYPNISKLYDNYKKTAYTYDQTKDIYLLKAIYEKYGEDLKQNNQTLIYDSDDKKAPAIKGVGNNIIINKSDLDIDEIKKIYIVGYMEDESSSNYNFNKYLKRMKKSVYSPKSYRLIGVFKNNNDNNYRFASIKMDF